MTHIPSVIQKNHAQKKRNWNTENTLQTIKKKYLRMTTDITSQICNLVHDEEKIRLDCFNLYNETVCRCIVDNLAVEQFET